MAHNSGGPKEDIVVPSDGQITGFLASTAEEYADAIYQALTSDKEGITLLRQRARNSAERFSDEVFSASFKTTVLESGLLS